MKKKIFSLFIVIILISGCGKEDNKGDEVVFGRDCGLEDLMCCNEDPKCFQGLQCCVNPSDSIDSYCAIDCGCGEKDSFCCSGDTCNDGLSCSNNRCLPCGKENEPCCGGDLSCEGDLICYKNECRSCGKNNQPCCEQDSCAENDKNGRLGCQSGICLNCGFDGFKACNTDPICLEGNIYSGEFCYQCGSNNQPCCNDDSGVDYKCKIDNGLVCNLGFCVENKVKK